MDRIRSVLGKLGAAELYPGKTLPPLSRTTTHLGTKGSAPAAFRPLAVASPNDRARCRMGYGERSDRSEEAIAPSSGDVKSAKAHTTGAGACCLQSLEAPVGTTNVCATQDALDCGSAQYLRIASAYLLHLLSRGANVESTRDR